MDSPCRGRPGCRAGRLAGVPHRARGHPCRCWPPTRLWRIGSGDLAARMSTELPAPCTRWPWHQRHGGTHRPQPGRFARSGRRGDGRACSAKRMPPNAPPWPSRTSSPPPATTCASPCMPWACSSRRWRSRIPRREPELVAHIRSATDTLQNLLDAILDVSRLDSGNVVPRIARPRSGRSGVQHTRDVVPDRREQGPAFADSPPMLGQLRQGHVAAHPAQPGGQCLRYTRSGGVLVACRRRGAGLVEVWDTGSGIPENAREEIFEEYIQLENPERDRAKGLGLGLAICRRLAGCFPAPIGVRSRPGRGSVFWITVAGNTTAMPPDLIRHPGYRLGRRRGAPRTVRYWWSTPTRWFAPGWKRRSPAGARR
jgi:hypothetical protein